MCHTMLLGRNVQETGGFNEFGRRRLPMVEVMDLDRTCKSSGKSGSVIFSYLFGLMLVVSAGGGERRV